MANQNYLTLSDLQIYQLSRQLSRDAWAIYKDMDWQMKKIIGDQFIRAIDSIGANIAEGYGRYHYLDKIKFYYNARASHYEAIVHWLGLLFERRLINNIQYQKILTISNELAPKLNAYINSTYRAKDRSQISNY
ncbi:four helix bundle protein [Candidatus Falkowbacteria bacterium CG11_big_fil_rev_8_21_14_0_20_39_10]|uniref:Four helix bundle protein n=1 Tax=Candidatus Falkowbacteria bacterium CG11_big_fil_rev_8_21_14_0_20_39_10 TaxID=1974570 RepID=A0A2M6K953_9BACT|nr:MAG: four helix bundle protein [Candidatus Falkowbacteria bacterium CG11_big_fil_rev_8_21_14_0_20_39_10]